MNNFLILPIIEENKKVLFLTYSLLSPVISTELNKNAVLRFTFGYLQRAFRLALNRKVSEGTIGDRQVLGLINRVGENIGGVVNMPGNQLQSLERWSDRSAN